MTGKVVNLRQARKRKAREDKSIAADENAVVHGLSKSEKSLANKRNDKTTRDLDGKKRT